MITWKSTSGLTLVELLVVLTIMAAVTTAAVVSTNGIFDQSKFEASQRTLEEIHFSVLGDASARDERGSLRLSGFLADVGRLPKAKGNDPLLQLGELWDPAGLPAYSSHTAAGDADVTMMTGWNGPYVRITVASFQQADGWGRPFLFFKADGVTSVADTDEIAVIKNLGADGAVGGVGFDADFPPLALSTLQSADLSGYVYYRTSGTTPVLMHGNRIIVRVYGPDPADSSLKTLKESSPIPVTGSPIFFSLPAVSKGPRIIRAYQVDSTSVPATMESVISVAGGEAVSGPLRIAHDGRPQDLILNDK
ncbi:MAG TPA: prepilin-type N-terminal cleavage/methylation domain-containing protein [Planctomycetota bacterium]|nr:prepilin-type N-terminal cleavage/methylation domain-containing protein [Planctomycetota bacterium]